MPTTPLVDSIPVHGVFWRKNTTPKTGAILKKATDVATKAVLSSGISRVAAALGISDSYSAGMETLAQPTGSKLRHGGVHPGALVSDDGQVWLAGVDYEVGPEDLEFHPAADVPSQSTVVPGGTRLSRSLLEYVVGASTDGRNRGKMARWISGNHSAEDLKAACLEAAGGDFLEQDSEVIEALPFGQGWVYLTTTDIITVPFPHDRVYRIAANSNPGIAVEVLGGPDSPGYWWTEVPWNELGGLPVEQLSGLPLTLSDGATLVSVDKFVDYKGSLKAHVTFALGGDAADVSTFHTRRNASELATGIFLADLLGLSPTKREVSIRAADLVFGFGIGRTTCLVLVRTDHPTAQLKSRVTSFVREHSPINCIPLVAFGPSTPGASVDDILQTHLGEVVLDFYGAPVLVHVQ